VGEVVLPFGDGVGFVMLAPMSLLPFGELAPYEARKFVPATARMGDWAEVEPLFDQLEQRLDAARDVSALESWLRDWGELSAALDEEMARRYIAMTCHTDNVEAEKAYLAFVEGVEPRTKPRQFRLEQRYLQHPALEDLPEATYEVFNRSVRVSVELFREENVPLETEESKLGQQYQKVSGGMTVEFDGKEQTLVQMGRYQENTDRSVRQRAWETVVERRLREREVFDGLFDQLADLRGRMAKNAGFDSYLDHAFRRLQRFDYTPEDCVGFHAAVEQEVMPVVRELQETRRGQMGLETLRPWDLGVDPRGRPPLKPFEGGGELIARTRRVFEQLDAGLAAGFARMDELHLLDLDNRKGKAPGGYQYSLAEARLPFIFMNAVGLQRDVETILHEAGHAFHALATQEQPLHAYRHAPIEFCEVASMSMELLGNDFLDGFYSEGEARRARRKHLEGVIEVLPWIATVDAFQHWLYTHPGHSVDARREAWMGLMNRFGGAVDWSGHEEARAHLWHRQLHIFLHPFYYIEYGLAQLGALQVWANSRQDRAGALKAYKASLALGGSRPLPDLFAAAGAQLCFKPADLRPLMALVREELSALSNS
jgi:oligoendopeptidase F